MECFGLLSVPRTRSELLSPECQRCSKMPGEAQRKTCLTCSHSPKILRDKQAGLCPSLAFRGPVALGRHVGNFLSTPPVPGTLWQGSRARWGFTWAQSGFLCFGALSDPLFAEHHMWGQSDVLASRKVAWKLIAPTAGTVFVFIGSCEILHPE